MAAVLGISMNTRLLSIAVLSDGFLAAYWTHLHKSPWSPRKRDEMVASLKPCVRQYCPNRVFLSIPPTSHQPASLQSLIQGVTDYFTAQGIPVSVHTPDAFVSLCPVPRRGYKKVLMRTMAERFPALRLCYQKELRNKNKYYFKLFEAVAGAVLASEGK